MSAHLPESLTAPSRSESVTRRRVLIIDDDSQMRCWLRTVLEAEGFEVTEADDGVTGLKSFERQPPALVVCDIFMPEKEGLSTIREMRRLNPRQPVIAMSGGGRLLRMDHLVTATHFGAAATLMKPFSADELVLAINAVLSEARPE
ncbi:MAG: response regulator [Gemmataceae bacterium]